MKFTQKRFKKITTLFLILAMAMSLSACSSDNADSKKKLVIAYQYGTGYAPFMVMQEKNLIEKYYPEREVEWQILNSGAAITEGLAAGSIDVAAMGVPPCITGITKGAPYKIYSNLSSQPHALTTNKPNIKSLSDITADDKIAAVNIGSMQHILLAMLAEKELGDAHALDKNIAAMSHPDGMQALLAGSVSCHQTSSPYTIKELKEDNIHLISDMTEVYPLNSPFIVGVASNEIHSDKELYDAIVKATKEAIDFINGNKEETAELICKQQGLSKEEALTYLNAEGSGFSSDLNGIMNIVTFMGRAKFINTVPKDIKDIAYEDKAN